MISFSSIKDISDQYDIPGNRVKEWAFVNMAMNLIILQSGTVFID
jgi:hypothetical protein